MIRLLIVGLACLWLSAPVALGLTLNRGNGAEPDTLDPQKYNLTVELNIIADLFEGLVTADEKGNPIPGIAERMKEFSATIVGSTPEELGKHVTAELAKWKPVVEGANIQMD